MSKPSHKPPCVFWYILRAKPLTSYKTKSIDFSRLLLLCSCFPDKTLSVLGNCGVEHVLYKYRMLLVRPVYPVFPSSSCHVLQSTFTFTLLAFSFPAPHPRFLLISSREKHASALHKMRAVNCQLASLSSADPSAKPRVGVRGPELWLCWQTLGILSHSQGE